MKKLKDILCPGVNLKPKKIDYSDPDVIARISSVREQQQKRRKKGTWFNLWAFFNKPLK